mmetsp:Transcript_45418/g.55124  ORF Transcript_45418/g.55124 Transcript_45418/m.55124 type:complete len:219 (+) Transcript_45418:478-1134(+)
MSVLRMVNMSIRVIYDIWGRYDDVVNLNATDVSRTARLSSSRSDVSSGGTKKVVSDRKDMTETGMAAFMMIKPHFRRTPARMWTAGKRRCLLAPTVVNAAVKFGERCQMFPWGKLIVSTPSWGELASTNFTGTGPSHAQLELTVMVRSCSSKGKLRSSNSSEKCPSTRLMSWRSFPCLVTLDSIFLIDFPLGKSIWPRYHRAEGRKVNRPSLSTGKPV